MRKFNGLNLAWWHTYKYSVGQIWKRFANEVFAPLWHNLYPGHTFYEKQAKVSIQVVHMMHLDMAYPAVQDKLHEVLTLPNVLPRTRVFVRDMIFLHEMAIPVVHESVNASTTAYTHAMSYAW